MSGLHKKRTCEVCATEYQPTYSRQRTCGRTCGTVIHGRTHKTKPLRMSAVSRANHYAAKRKLELAANSEHIAELRKANASSYMLKRYHEDPDNWSTKKKRRRIFERDGWRCRVCGIEVSENLPKHHPRKATAMHIVAAANGGRWEPHNIATGCRSCNVADGVERLPIQTHAF